MRAVAELSREESCGLDGLLFDLDDTVLDHGVLGLPAYAAVWRLREAGLVAIAVTGRPCSWGELVLRTWPIDAAVAENGAVALVREGGRVTIRERATEAERAERTARLAEIVERARREVPEVGLADDVRGRRTDVTWDIGEHVRVPEETVARLMALVTSAGARTSRSSVHVHATFEVDDKASGVVRLLRSRGVDATRARARYAFVGDSANDAPCFAAFRTTFGVANVADSVGRVSVPPRWVARRPRGEGFAEIVDAILTARG